MTDVTRTLGKYQILGPLGRGGMGEVFKALQPDLHRHVAIKTLLVGEHATPEFLERFQREARLVAGLAHPNIVQIYDIGAEGKLHYIVMELVEGRSLRDLLAKGKLDLEKSLKIAHTVARTLQFAHARKIIHRDVKPANVLVDRQGRVKVLDFGLAKSLADGKGLTHSGAMIGSPQYMAPEQAFGAPEEVDARADLYSLAALLYEMVTGRPPFDGPTVLAILRRMEEEDPEPPGVSPAVDALLLRGLAKDPEKRFQTAAEMAEAIRECLGGGAGEPSATGFGLVRGLAPRRRAMWAAGLALAVASAIVAWAAWPDEKPGLRDPEIEIRDLLAEGGVTGLDDEAVKKYREVPHHRELVVLGRLKRGQFSRTAPDLEGYEHAVYELASAASLQRFVSPGLFRLSIKEAPNLKGAQGFLAAAIARHLEGRQEAAREKLRAAVSLGAHSGHVLLVRAHIDLWDIWPDPQGEASKPVLRALREALDRSSELYLLPLRALAAQLEGDPQAGWQAANRLGDKAPSAAETFLLRSILYQRQGNIFMAREQLADARRLDPDHFDGALHDLYLRWIDLLGNPEGERPDLAAVRKALDDRMGGEPPLLALLLRGVLNALESRWEAAEADLAALGRRAMLDRITVDHALLSSFVWYASGPRSRLLVAARDLQQALGRGGEALATAALVTGEGLADEDRRQLLLENHYWIALQSRADEEKALAHLEETLKLGRKPEELRADENLGDFRQKPAFEELLKKY